MQNDIKSGARYTSRLATAERQAYGKDRDAWKRISWIAIGFLKDFFVSLVLALAPSSLKV
jgi:hypothetical protein